MLAIERHTEILRSLRQSGAVSVIQLAERFAVTDETIRRDLAKLARGGRLVRTHGGAVAIEAGEPPYVERLVTNVEEKRLLATAAIAYLKPGEVIAIDASSTGLEFARALPEGDFTVVTNGLDVLRTLAPRTDVALISTGGEYDRAGECFVGPIAEASLRSIAVGLAVLSCRGVDPSCGCSEASPAHASYKRAVLAMAERSLLLVDHTKLGRRSVALFAHPGDFTAVVTDHGATPDDVDRLQQSGVRVVTAGPNP
ncbi:MAG: DeoR/GlpR family DNA-binding transcription regulator [Lacipirellulaceae bacterium]